MRALVTGAAGFVGRHLCPKLKEAGYEVFQVDPAFHSMASDVPIYSYRFDQLFNDKPYRSYADAELTGPFHLVVHLAANIVNVDARMKGGMQMFDDIELDLAMCRWLEKNPPKQAAVLMSSCAVDFPEDPYCVVKRNLESFANTLRKKGVPVIVLRPFSGYGEDQSEEYPFRAILERALRKDDPLTVWGGAQVRDWIHVDDLTEAILIAVSCVPPSAAPIEVGTGRGISLKVLARKIADAVGYVPGLLCDEDRPASSKRRVAGESSASTLQQASSSLWYPQISLEEGIRRAVQSRLRSESLDNVRA